MRASTPGLINEILCLRAIPKGRGTCRSERSGSLPKSLTG